MADLRDYLGSPITSRNGRRLCYAILAFALFLMFLIADFPYADVLSAVLAPSGLSVDYQAQRLSLPFGARLYNVRLEYSSGSADQSTIIESPTVTLSPTLGSLLLGQTGLRIQADLPDGFIRATMRRNGAIIALNFTARDVELSGFRRLGLFSIAGAVSGEGALEIAGSDALDGTGSMRLAGKRLSVRLAPTMPAVELDEAIGDLSVDRGIVSVEKLEGRGPDLSLSASGTIRLAQPPRDSTLDLRLTLSPTPVGRGRFAMLLAFLPHPPDSRPYILRGPLTFPSIS